MGVLQQVVTQVTDLKEEIDELRGRPPQEASQGRRDGRTELMEPTHKPVIDDEKGGPWPMKVSSEGQRSVQQVGNLRLKGFSDT